MSFMKKHNHIHVEEVDAETVVLKHIYESSTSKS
jgi:hypothetical protein